MAFLADPYKLRLQILRVPSSPNSDSGAVRVAMAIMMNSNGSHLSPLASRFRYGYGASEWFRLDDDSCEKNEMYRD